LGRAFVADGGEQVAGVRVREEGVGSRGEVFGEAEVGVVRGQVARRGVGSLASAGRGRV
jgi:hypothetical protein